MSDKQLGLNIIKDIDDITSCEEILYALYTQLEVQKGIKDMEEGNTKTSKKVKEIIKKKIINLRKINKKPWSNSKVIFLSF